MSYELQIKECHLLQNSTVKMDKQTTKKTWLFDGDYIVSKHLLTCCNLEGDEEKNGENI